MSNDIVIDNLYNRLVILRDLFANYKEDYNSINGFLKDTIFCNKAIMYINDLVHRYVLTDSVVAFINGIVRDLKIITEKYDIIKTKKQVLRRKLKNLNLTRAEKKLPPSDIRISNLRNLGTLNELNHYIQILDEEEEKINQEFNILDQECDDNPTAGKVGPKVLMFFSVLAIVAVAGFIAIKIFNLLK